MMKRILKEPLFHFLVGGVLLFAAHAWLNRGVSDEPETVRITAAEVNWLKETWALQWQRQPNEQELRGLVSDYLKEVLLAREATALGLDVNDTVVRRRLAQKMEFLLEDTARLAEPAEEELRRLYIAGGVRYQAPARISFSQIFFNSEAAAKSALAKVSTHPASELGDRTLLESDFKDTDQQAVTGMFGNQFAEKLFTLEPGRWHGPVASGYGFHLIRISDLQLGKSQPFEAVRSKVLEDWQRSQHTQINSQFYTSLLKKYDVQVEDAVKPLIEPIAIAGVTR
jgi:parvulin-like peptidyl-prolyl isomerase